MTPTIHDLHGLRVLALPADGNKIRNDRDAADIIGEAFPFKAGMVVIPVERLEESFFRLATRQAGEIVQKFVTYRMRIAILGDIARHLGDSSSLRDFVAEANCGEHIWFVESLEELGGRLQKSANPGRARS